MRLLLIALLCAPSLQDGSVEELIKQLGATSFEEQGKAAKALEDLGSKALPALDKAAQSGDSQVREWAERIRRRIVQREEARLRLEEQERRRRVEPLIQRLGSQDFEEQGRAAEEIKKLGASAIPYLKEAARKGPSAEVSAWIQKLLTALGEKPSDLGGVASGKGPYAFRFEKRTPDPMVSAALVWLARHQGADGGWTSKHAARCTGAKCSVPVEPDYEVGVTGLALLAFLGAGYTHLSTHEIPDPIDQEKKLKYGETVKRGLEWLMTRQDPEGCLGQRGQKYVYNHAIAAQALCEAYGMTSAPPLKPPAQKAVDFLVACQNPGKGWRYSFRCGDNDTSVTSWGVATLRAAELCELAFPKSAREGPLNWLNEVTDSLTSFVGYNAKNTGKVFVPGKNEQFDGHPTMTACGIVSRLLIDRNKDDATLAAVKLLMKDVPKWSNNAIDFYYWYHGTSGVYLHEGASGPLWKAWIESARKALGEGQRTLQHGCTYGSWDPEMERWGFEGGRACTTALGALILETPHRLLRPAPPKK